MDIIKNHYNHIYIYEESLQSYIYIYEESPQSYTFLNFYQLQKKTIISFFFFKNLIRISLIRVCKFFWLHFNTQKKYTIYRTSYVFLVFNIFFLL